ncbi:AAA family ATPase [Candidatus Poribacteria bacterium]|nr:AAA family ATPase [Candidatus Poribacteria bacterium]
MPFFVTFYSFKGGVGRTIALVNTAVALAKQNKSVIIWDMDLEAPGIQNLPFFKPLKSKIKGGFVDIVEDFKKNNYQSIDEKKISSYLISDPDFFQNDLKLLPAGNLDTDYSKKFCNYSAKNKKN